MTFHSNQHRAQSKRETESTSSAVPETIGRSTPYATGEDFCRIFESDMQRLYLLSLLLTADPAKAEECFVQGLEDARQGSAVFREWAESWARRTIIVNAIRALRPWPAGTDGQEAGKAVAAHALSPEMAAILNLPTFERFVAVLSVLEGYSLRECSLLLGCSAAEVLEARTRALSRLGESPQASGRVASSGERAQAAAGEGARAAFEAALRSLPALA